MNKHIKHILSLVIPRGYVAQDVIVIYWLGQELIIRRGR